MASRRDPDSRFLCGLILFLLLITPRISSGQAALSGEAVRLRRALSSVQVPPSPQSPAVGHYDVVALRVEFQPDTSVYTTGTGVFDGPLFDDLSPRIDPLPHDAAYFEAHLAFLADYVAKASDGKVTVTTHLIPEVVRLPKAMSAYSPTGPASESDAELVKLARLPAEAWALAGEQSAFNVSGLDPARTAFVIFHAGVGRDLELTGTTLDRTPEDLPSIFFSSEALNRLLPGTPIRFKGLPVEQTILLPRTETRRGLNPITDEPFLAEFSINGMLAASFFNFLGVPDLFDTETGQSVIGPFGLMDPLGIFAYNGLFPPLPSAWTRHYLGWAEAIELTGSEEVEVALPAVSLPGGQDLARAWISDTEYFLVENRHRDPDGDGLTLRVWKDGQVVEQHIENGDERFNSATVEGFVGGVVMGASDYDWALPGGLDENGNALLGGMLVWHVDTREFAERLGRNALNTHGGYRTIDLEEADGAQDIGFPSTGLFGAQVEIGSPFDFFFQGNPVTVETQFGGRVTLYRNRFGPDTYPNSHSNGGGPSFVVLEDFSLPGATMTFTYRLEAGEAGAEPLAPLSMVQLTAEAGSDLTVFPFDNGRKLVVATGRRKTEDPSVVLIDAVEGQFVAEFRGNVVANAIELASGEPLIVVQVGRQLSFVSYAGATTFEILYRQELPDGYTVHPHLTRIGEQVYLHLVCDGAACSLGETLVYRYDVAAGELSAVDTDFPEPVYGLASDGENLILVGSSRATVTGAGTTWTYTPVPGIEEAIPVFGRDRSGLVGFVPGEGTGGFLLADGNVVALDAGVGAAPVLADLDGDGLLDVLGSDGERLVAYTQGGAVVAGFPIPLRGVVSQPLVFENDAGTPVVIASSLDGYVHAFEVGARRELPGFPLASGPSQSTPTLRGDTLYAVSVNGSLSAWRIENTGKVIWGQRYGNARHTSFVSLEPDSGAPVSGDGLIVTSETYNWPNPVRTGETNLRCMVTRNARVEFTIVDLAGKRVGRVDAGEVRGGVPVELLWPTDAPSGLYVVKVTATADGDTESRLFKMAIIR